MKQGIGEANIGFPNPDTTPLPLAEDTLILY